MIIQNYIHHFINYHRSSSSLDDEDLYIEEFSYGDNARRITSLVSEQLKQPDFTFTGVSVSWKKLCMINKKGNFLHTFDRGRSILMTMVLEFRHLPKYLNILEETLLKMVVDDFLVSYSSFNVYSCNCYSHSKFYQFC